MTPRWHQPLTFCHYYNYTVIIIIYFTDTDQIESKPRKNNNTCSGFTSVRYHKNNTRSLSRKVIIIIRLSRSDDRED